MCNCISEINSQLEQYNSALEVTLPLKAGARSRIILSTRKLDTKKKGKAITLTGSFCPFCGSDVSTDFEQQLRARSVRDD